MNAFETIITEWRGHCELMHQSPGFRRILSGEITIAHYKALMRQIFHHARENPQIQALATVYFRGQQRKSVKSFYKHATSEIGHDQLALNDLKALGEDVSGIPYESPLPSTLALLGYAFYQIQYRNPVSYLGYLFHLEFMPTQHGAEYVKSFRKAGATDESLSFIFDHTTVDVGHNKLMEAYIKDLVCTKADLEAVIAASKVTAKLYGNMVSEAFEAVDSGFWKFTEGGQGDRLRTFGETLDL